MSDLKEKYMDALAGILSHVGWEGSVEDFEYPLNFTDDYWAYDDDGDICRGEELDNVIDAVKTSGDVGVERDGTMDGDILRGDEFVLTICDCIDGIGVDPFALVMRADREVAAKLFTVTTKLVKETKITRDYLRSHPDEVFVFGDNIERRGHGGAAALRDEPNTYGFITKKVASFDDIAHFTPEEYASVYLDEMRKLTAEITANPSKTYLISRVGQGLANKFGIWEKLIEPTIRAHLSPYKNVKFLWEEVV